MQLPNVFRCLSSADAYAFFRMAINSKLVWQIWFDTEDGTEPLSFYKVLVGFTPVPNDILLFMVDVEDVETPDIDKLIETRVQGFMLSKLVTKYGVSFDSDDQIEEDEKE